VTRDAAVYFKGGWGHGDFWPEASFALSASFPAAPSLG
jgi:hypothetical protein